jgi:hypothetical protein
MPKKLFALLFFVGVSAYAQPVGLGVKFGVPLNDAFSVQSPNPLQYVADTHRYTVGPYIELRLPLRFAIEVDALYKSYDFQRSVPTITSVSASSWEFPVLAKYKILPGPIQPYIEGGVAYARLMDVPNIVELNATNNLGVVAGAGLELHLGFLRISPEIRYTGWSRRFFNSPGDYLQSNRNQATVLVGISF